MGGILDEDPSFGAKLHREEIKKLREKIAEFCKKYDFESLDWFRMGSLITELQDASFKLGCYMSDRDYCEEDYE